MNPLDTKYLHKIIDSSQRTQQGPLVLGILVLGLFGLVAQQTGLLSGNALLAYLVSIILVIFILLIMDIVRNARNESSSSSAIDPNEHHPFQLALIKQLRNECDENVQGVSTLSFTTRMNWERVFLKRVSALYHGAETVHAVTLSSISDFWVSKQDEKLIIDYLKCQKGRRIFRLFVFESPYDLRNYENILKLNYLAYGKPDVGGAVLVTSAGFYQSKILSEIAPAESRFNFLDLDFGFWKSEIEILAELKGTSLDFKKVENYSDLVHEIDVVEFKKILESPPPEIVKWEEDSSSIDIAESIFTEDVTYVGPITHLVLLKHENTQLLEEISASVKRLDDIQRLALEGGESINFCQDEPWWGVNLAHLDNVHAFTDGKWGGRLITSNEYPYILRIDLPSLDDLDAWYKWKPHSDIRKEIYCKLLSELESIYEKVERNELKFDDIEEKMAESGLLKRMDYIYNRKLHDMDPFIDFEKAKSRLFE